MMLDIISEEVIRQQIDRNEKLLWCGQPRQGIVFRSNDIFMIPFSLLWGGFAIFWEVTVLTMMPKDGGVFSIIFPLWGIPFVLVGLYMIFGRFFVDSKKRKNTYYGVTDQRVIIISGIFSRKIDSHNLKNLANLSLQEKSDRSGIISFGPDHPFAWWCRGNSWPGMNKIGPEFEMIEDAKEVYETIRKAQDMD